MISDELNKLRNTKSAIKTALETPSNDFSSYAELIEKYVNNQPTKKTTGTCDNAVDLPIKSGGVFGNSLQGENPTPDNPQEIEVVENGYNCWEKGISYTTISNKYVLTDTRIPKLKSGTYTISLKNSSGVDILFTFKDKNRENRQDVRFTTSKTFTLNTDKEYAAIYVYANGTETTISDIQITEGTEPKPYLPYGSIALEQKGINKLNFNKYAKTWYGVNLDILTNEISLNGTSTQAFATNDLQLKQPIVLSKGCAITVKILEGSFTGTFYIDCYNESNSKIIAKSFTTTKLTATDTTIGTISKIQVGLTANAVCTNLKLAIQIEDNTTATSYEPYHEPIIYPINLQGNKLSKVGDIRDKLKIYRNGNVEIEKNIGEINSYNNENITTNYISKTGQLTNGTQVYYELATSQTISLPQIEPIKMWQGTNIFKLISNLDSDIEIEYVVESEAQ